MVANSNIEQYFINILTVSLYLAKYESVGIAKLGEGMSTEDTLRFIANKLSTKLPSLKGNINDFKKRLGLKRGLTEITITKKKVFERYADTTENEFYAIVEGIINTKDNNIEPKVNIKEKLDTNLIRVFNEYGNEQFINHYYMAVEDNKHKIPKEILFSSEYTEVLEGALPIDQNKKFKNRYELGKYIYELTKEVKVDIFNNSFLWNWLSAFYFKDIFPGPSGGMQDIRYILSEQLTHKYRHLIRENWRIYSEYKEDAIYLLTKQINAGSDEIEQLAGRQNFLNSNTIKLISELYMNKQGDSWHFKRNATNRNKPGNLRRLQEVCQGMQLNYFLPTMNFDKFKQLVLKIPEFQDWI